MLRFAIFSTAIGGASYYTLPYLEHKNIYAGARHTPKLPDHNPDGYKHPGERNIPYENISLKTPDGHSINGWLVLQPDSIEKPTLVFFHSNSGNRGSRMNYI